MARTLVTAIAAAGLLAAAGAALTVPASAKPTAGEHGEGEGIRVCLQCDENWRKLQGNACLARAGTLDAADI
jgi:uncharacterized protein YdbL (DUF1318 family)